MSNINIQKVNIDGIVSPVYVTDQCNIKDIIDMSKYLHTGMNTATGLVTVVDDKIYSEQGELIGSIRGGLKEDLQKELKHQGLRYNDNKIRYDLIHPYANEQLAKVFTKGADKYQPRNWEKGMSWSGVIASLKRHLAALEAGEDYDLETGLLHSAHIQWNAHALTAYYKIYPEGDDRPHTYLKPKRIGLDIDDVLADWLGSFCKIHNMELPKSWQFHRNLEGAFNVMKEKGINIDDWMCNLSVKTKPEDIPFEPAAYITARTHTPKWVAEHWLDKNGFPTAPVYQVPGNKVEACRQAKIDIFIDDRYENFVELNNAGICCYLFDAPHNQRYNVGHKRIKSLKELV